MTARGPTRDAQQDGSTNHHDDDDCRARSPGVGRRRRASWWKELGLVAIFYGLYSAVRDVRGTSSGAGRQGYANAQRIIRIERALALFHEQQVQHLFLRWSRLVEILNDVYNTAHFLVPAAILILLFRRAHEDYRAARNTLALTTGLALVGFALFPLMPPRLLPSGYHFVDTLRTVGGLWSFGSGPVAAVSNQYAAMPSLHMAWAMWSAAVALPHLRPTCEKLVAVAYPAVTLFCIVVTANHYFLDAAAGLVIFGIARSIQRGVDRRTAKHSRY